ncbi:hypothetical protein LCGC14_0374320 [marine sediment metagenome]|uniref:Novel STAND NTPase 3 domain-containing protein n=1 Tax=marine sediment metagenome TaxID=412755 RepID=A0A0F9TM89_9ZZZZ
MTIVFVNDKHFYLNQKIKLNLDFVKDRVLNHNDMCISIFDGRPGTGKSTHAVQQAYYLSDGKLTLDHICFSIEEFENALRKAKKGDAIVLDEGFIINKRTSQSKENRRILNLLQQMREQNVFIFIVLPCVYDLDRNIILNLCDFFLHFYREDFGKRGQYAAYDRISLKKLYIHCRDTYSYFWKVARPNFSSNFTKQFPLNYPGYLKKKLTSLRRGEQTKTVKAISQRNKLVGILKDEGKTVQEIADMSGLSTRQVYRIFDEIKDKEE